MDQGLQLVDKYPNESATLPIASTSTLSNIHLSYPSATSDIKVQTPTSQPRQLLKDRLYVGNLHPSVDEYTLLQVFSKFGKISKLDYLFYKAGPLKGKPRGYAFVEFSSKDDAQKALVHANDKLLRGRKLVITYAHQAPLDQMGAHGSGGRYRKGMSELGKPTTLSLIKSAAHGRSDATEDKIAKMEAKLRQMEKQAASSSLSSGHPSLPAKPPPSFQPTSGAATSGTLGGGANRRTRVKSPLPALPIVNPGAASRSVTTMVHQASAYGSRKSSGPSLPGMRRLVKDKGA